MDEKAPEGVTGGELLNRAGLNQPSGRCSDCACDGGSKKWGAGYEQDVPLLTAPAGRHRASYAPLKEYTMGMRKKRGFTLTELILVVTIIAVLLAIAAPNVIGYYRRLALTELDDSARTIFLAAQNRLTALHAAGTDFSDLASNKVDLHDPSGTGAPKLVYAARDGGEADGIVPAGSIDPALRDNHYVVEFDPENGAVYAVWYWEKESFTYEHDAYVKAQPDREKRFQAGINVGYYGGDYVDRVKLGQMPFPQVTLTNAEELVLEITVPKADTSIKDEKIFVTVSVNGTELYLGSSDNARNLWKEHTGTVVLDTLTPEKYAADLEPVNWTVGNPFQGWHTGVAPGEDLTIRVTLSYEGGEYLPQSIYVEGNSLFASREGAIASVAYGRHLQNLDPAVSGVEGVTEAVQIADIDFFDNTAVTGLKSWRDTYSDRAFQPITKAPLTSYDGNGHAIRNLTTKDGAVTAGLFTDPVTGFEVHDLTLIDAKVSGTDAAGALTGDTVGGLVGKADGITLASSYAAGVIVSGATVGGLTPSTNVTAVVYAAGDIAPYAAVVYGEDLSKPGATVYGAYPGGTGIQYIRQGGVNFAANSGSGSLAPTRAELGTAVPYYLTDETKLLTTAYPYERTVKGEDGALLPHYGDWLEYQLQGTELVYVEWYEGGGVGLYAAEVEADGSVKPVRNSLRTDRDAVVVRDTYRIISSMNPTLLGGTALTEDTDEQLANALPGGFKAYEIDNGNPDHKHYIRLDITDTEGNKAFLYNPDFACEAFAVAAATPAPAEFLEKPGVTETGASTADVLVRSARHLANVSEYTREVPEAGGWTYTQLLNVDYEKYESPFTTGKGTDHLQAPAKLGTMGKYDGRGHLVKNLWLGEDAGCSGLFGSVDNGAVVQDVVLVNVNAAGTGDTGALVGYLGNRAIITRCGVYCEKRGDYDTYTVSSAGTAGGLVGVLHGGSVSRSFAAVQVSGKACAGGFVGRVENGVSRAFVENCYAGGRTEGGKYGTVSAGVNVTSDVVAGGFVGDYASGSFSGVNYSTCSVGSGTAGLFAGQGPDIAKGADTDMLYATGAAFKNDGTGWASAASRRENYLLTGSALPGGSVTLENTFNYDSLYDTARYPYASRLNTHHGDWGVPTTAGIFYWELEDGKYRFYILTWDGKEAAVEDGLCRKHACGHQVEDWGYGVFGLSGTNGDTGDNAKKALELLQSGRPAAVLAYTLPKNQTSLIEVNTGIDGKVLVCDTRFGAAMAEEEKVAELRREVRAFDQLEHVAGNGTLAFTQTHDVNAKDKALADLSLTGSGVYDGGFYRILDLKIDAGSGDAALFSAVQNGAAVKNVILYAPEGDGTIEGANAAGIVAKLDGGTVDSCVAAGYTVSGSGNVGGLVASASENSAVKNSEATVKLKSTDASAKIGGLVGNAGGTLTVENCCAGGSIDTTGVEIASIGGLVGAGAGTVTFENVYSYVDMTSATAGKVYGIGPGTVKTDSRICEYWYAGLPAQAGSVNKPVDTGDKDTDGVLGVTLAQLRNDTQKLGASAEELYIPGAEGLVNQITLADINDTQKYKKFPFAAFVTDRTVPGDVKNLHYGAWPTSAYAGLFYYEKEEITRLVHGTQVTETVYNYYAYGGEIYKSAMRGEKLLDGLCYDHHLTGERAGIVETGYGYFYPEGEEGIAYTLKVDKKIATGSEVPNDDPVKENLIKSLSANGDYKVFLTTPTNDYKTVEWTLEAKNGSSPVGSVAMYVNDAFGAVIAENDDIGEKDGGDCLQIRTVEQLKKFLNATSTLEYFAISHDIDLKNVSWTPDKAEGTLLDGRGYRVLDLNVKLETGDAGLFSSVESGMEIKNIILYSPDASGQISTKSGSAGGIAGANSGSKITNCIVSGYTITGTGFVGGIVGDAGSNATIAQCQTDVILTGEATAIGGIAGKANSAHLQKCVTGGQVYGAENDTKVGGLYGQSSGDVDVSGSYTYMDLIRTGADTVNVHAIGEKPATTSSEVFFLESMMPEEYSEAGQGTPFTIQTFPNNPNADYTFIPNDGDPFDGLAHETIDDQEYHHRTYVTVTLDPNHDKGVTAAGDYLVHYGECRGPPMWWASCIMRSTKTAASPITSWACT